jgi:hypothetical protein
MDMLEYPAQIRARSGESLGQHSRLSCCKADANEVRMNQTSRWTRLWNSLKVFQNRVAVALTVSLLFILYFTVFAVIAIIARLTGKDLLHPDKPEPGTYWLAHQPAEHTLETFARQF